MKRVIRLVSLTMVLGTISFAQFAQKDVELALNASFNSWSTSSSGQGYTNSNQRTVVVLSGSIGYFLVDGISLESELGLLAVEDQDPAQYLLAGLSYTYLAPEAKVAPFIHAAYGISNAVQYPLLGGTPMKISNEMDVKVTTVGGGVKYLVSPWAALRLEINYKSHNGSREYETSYSYPDRYASKMEYQYSNVGLLVGFSILL